METERGPGTQVSGVKQRVSFKPVERTSLGTIGRNVNLVANHCKLLLKKTMNIYHYDVELYEELKMKKDKDSPDSDTSEREIDLSKSAIVVNRRFIEDFMRNAPEIPRSLAWAYDGRKNLYTNSPLKDSESFFKFSASEEIDAPTRDLKLRLRLVNELGAQDLTQWYAPNSKTAFPQEYVTALDIVFRQTNLSIFVPVGKSFFGSNGAFSIGDGTSAWRGHYQSVRPVQSGLTLNIDQKYAAFYNSLDLLSFCGEILNLDGRPFPTHLDNRMMAKLKKELRAVKMYTTHFGYRKTYRFFGFANKNCDQTEFEHEGRKISVTQYYRQKYNIQLRYPGLNPVSTSLTKDIFIPFELFTVSSGQRRARKLTARQTADMIKVAASKPMDRMRTITDVARNLVNDPVLESFGLNVNPQLLEVRGRVIEPPYVQYGSNKRCAPNVGQWNMKDFQLLNPAPLVNWGVMVFVNNRDLGDGQVDDFIQQFMRMAKAMGSPKVDRPSVMRENPHDTLGALTKLKQRIEQNNKGQQATLIFCMIQEHDYKPIKLAGDTVLGVTTQCLQAFKLRRLNPQYLSNVMLKVNAKLGGQNCQPLGSQLQALNHPFEKAPYMIIGGDVSHPNPGSDQKSIAALVGSFDPKGVRYAASMRGQTSRTEMMNQIGAMFTDLVNNFYAYNKVYPLRLIIYRDGVSEGQFQQVIDYELWELRDACQKLGFRPFMTFITVQKRHNTRFFAKDKRDTDRSGNVLPGTVVDNGVCHPKELDFYLCSHAGIQGTSKPSHYKVLYDDNKFTVDQIQYLTNRLCYGYVRCPRAVSIVPAAYYAHHLAFRGRDYLGEDSEDGSVASGGRGRAENLPNVHKNLSSSMFYI